MATEQSQEECVESDWRAKQRERERERRGMWDKLRGQSMTLEEREKHLARRRETISCADREQQMHNWAFCKQI